MIRMRVSPVKSGLSLGSLGVRLFRTSMPSITCPKTECLPSRCGCGPWVMKNWPPLVLGPLLARIHRRTPMDGVRTAEGGG